MPNHAPQDPRKQAERCRRFAESTTDRVLARQLLDLAEEFEAEAEQADDAPRG
jgi:hypothetical protein